MKIDTKKYTNGEITVVWKPQLCVHSALCWKGGLLEVFNPHARPWINMDGANTECIIVQVEKCPSRALSYYWNDETRNTKPSVEVAGEVVEVIENGPLLVYGNIRLKDANGSERNFTDVTAFCRCGVSKNKPFCDGTHTKINFNG